MVIEITIARDHPPVALTLGDISGREPGS